MEWESVQGNTVECRLPIYAEHYEPDSTLLVVRAAVLAPENFRCSILLQDEPVGRPAGMVPIERRAYCDGRQCTATPTEG